MRGFEVTKKSNSGTIRINLVTTVHIWKVSLPSIHRYRSTALSLPLLLSIPLLPLLMPMVSKVRLAGYTYLCKMPYEL